MALGWTDSTVFRFIQNELAIRTERDFERYALHLIRLIWAGAVGAPARRKFDSAGADHLVWSDNPPFPVVIQCKGWEVMDADLGRSQITQCVESINSFQKGGLLAEKYILVHNRTGENQKFRQTVEKKLKMLVTSKQVKQAELWDRRRLAQEAFEAFYQRCLLNIDTVNLSRFHNFQWIEKSEWEPITFVPLKSSILTVDQYQLVQSGNDKSKVADPCEEILSSSEKLSILIGPAGFGKSVTAFRLAQSDDRKAIYIPAASINKTAQNTTELLKQAISLEDVLKDSLPEDAHVHELIAREVIAKILKKGEAPMIMILDGLDESIYFNKKDGIQHLMNIVKEDIGIPTVLTARSEYWSRKETDFSSSFGIRAIKSPRKVRKIRFIELQEWDEDKILELIMGVKARIKKPNQLARVQKLADLIASGQYSDFYGDIPKRPLFLRFIIETVLERDPHKVNRAQLFREWVSQKILRDLSNPKQFGGQRISIASESEDQTTIELSFLIMTHAAVKMTKIETGVVQLLPSCVLDSVTATHPKLSGILDPTGILLNSLLVLVKTAIGDPAQIAFTHRLFQEFFLARAINHHIVDFSPADLPDSIQEWMKDLQNEAQT